MFFVADFWKDLLRILWCWGALGGVLRHLVASWGCLWALLGALGRALGALGSSWVLLGGCLGALGRSWGALGCSLGAPWGLRRPLGRSLEALWELWTLLGSSRVLLGSSLGAPGSSLGSSWALFGVSLGRPGGGTKLQKRPENIKTATRTKKQKVARRSVGERENQKNKAMPKSRISKKNAPETMI